MSGGKLVVDEVLKLEDKVLENWDKMRDIMNQLVEGNKFTFETRMDFCNKA